MMLMNENANRTERPVSPPPRAWHTHLLVLSCFLLACVWLNPARAAVDCDVHPWDVANLADWNDAIACFNGKGGGNYTINLMADMNLTAISPTIQSAAGVNTTLTINGNGKEIDGQETSGVRPITVAANTTVTINQTVIRRGLTGFGGGVLNQGTLTINDSTIKGNESSYGGGLDNYGQLTLNRCQVTGNQATTQGGGVYNDPGATLIINDSTFYNNNGSASGNGGAVYNLASGVVTATNSTFTFNSANKGGGIYNRGTLNLIHTTFNNNQVSATTGDSKGGGIYNDNAALIVLNSIVTGSNGSGGNCININNGTVTAINTLMDGPDAFKNCSIPNNLNGNIIGPDPLLVDLANNGGATQTHALQANSPAINAVTNDASTTGLTLPSVDQRGVSRPQGDKPDIGAYEVYGCGSGNTWDVNTGAHLSAAIACFNQKTAPDSYTINLTADALLAASTPVINNTTPDVTLTINGDGNKINGQNIAGVRPIAVAANTTVTINDATITGGFPAYYGGGVENYGTLTLNNSHVDGNQGSVGGGIFNEGELTLHQSTVANNQSGYGGGIYNNQRQVNIIQSSIHGNTAEQLNGGGIYSDGALTIIDSTIRDNQATETSSDGGGIYSSDGSLILTRSTVSDNTATRNGGGIYSASGVTVNVTNSTISGNTASTFGGGMHNLGNTTLTNSTLSGNQVTASGTSFGGNIYNGSGQLTLMHTTVAQGVTAWLVGGVYIEAGSTVTLLNSLLSGNGSGDCFGSVSNESKNNLIQSSGANACDLTNGTTTNNIIGQDPQLIALADNGGATQTHALQATSPAVNAGINDAGTTGLTLPGVDQRGVSRMQGGVPDIGAYEVYGCGSGNTWDVGTDGDLIQAILCFNAKSTAGDYTINLTGNAFLSTSTPVINNTTPDVTLTINGDGNKIDGQNIAGVRPIDVAGNTRVNIDNIILTGGEVDSNSTYEEQFGGGLRNKGILTLTRSKVIANTATQAGGIFDEGVLHIDQCIIQNNQATFIGAGLATIGTDASITNSVIDANTSSETAGALYNGGTLTVSNTTISNNVAEKRSGAIENAYGGSLSLTNSTITGNQAPDIGGIYNSGSNLTSINSTIYSNTATDATRAVGVHNTGTLSLTNTIIAHNSVNTGGSTTLKDCVNSGSGSVTAANNLIESTDPNACGLIAANGNIIGQDPLLVALADNGGLTQTHALQATSPAINAGTSTGAPAQDQRGVARDGLIDIGAYESYDCSGNSWDVNNEVKLSAAIQCFNGKSDAETYTINLTDDVALNVSTPSINNGSGAKLSINGADHVLNGQNRPGVRLIHVTSGNIVMMERIALNNGLARDGAAVLNEGTLTITSSSVSSNVASEYGGGIVNAGTLKLIQTSLIENTGKYGGAVHNQGTLTLTDSTLRDNQAERGGGINNSSTLTVIGSTISGSEATSGNGGGILNTSELTLTNSTVSDNTTTGSGGGIFNLNGTLTLTNSTVSGSTASESGGGILNLNGTLTLTNNTVRGNTAKRGGGIENLNGSLTVTNSTISGNESTTFDAGGVFNANGHLTLTNSTVYGNTAREDRGAGAGVDSYGNTAQLTLTNTIIANNTADGTPSDCENRADSTLNTSSNNLIQSGDHACGLTSSDNIIGQDPKLGDLANNGGATQTHALLAGSPAFNAGTSTGAPSEDQRGVSRTANGAPDIGAYEARAFTLSVDVDIRNTTGTGSYSQNPLGTSHMEGSTVTIQGFPDAGSSMLWGGACTGGNVSGNDCTLTMDADKTVTYAFVSGSSGGTTFTLTTSSAGTGGGTIGVSPFSSSGQYNSGVSLILTATPDGNSQFVKWGGACSGTSITCNLSMDGNKIVTAEFKKNPIPAGDYIFDDGFED